MPPVEFRDAGHLLDGKPDVEAVGQVWENAIDNVILNHQLAKVNLLLQVIREMDVLNGIFNFFLRVRLLKLDADPLIPIFFFVEDAADTLKNEDVRFVLEQCLYYQKQCFGFHIGKTILLGAYL